MEYTRENLIKRCEEASVPQKKWLNRDSAGAQQQVGRCLMLLKAGCDFKILREGRCGTDIATIWIEIAYKGFNWFEGGFDDDRDMYLSKDTFYLPQSTRLGDGDWY